MRLNFYHCIYSNLLGIDTEIMIGPRRMGLGFMVSIQADYLEVDLTVPFVQIRATRYSG